MLSTHQGAFSRFHLFQSLWRSTAEGICLPRSLASSQAPVVGEAGGTHVLLQGDPGLPAGIQLKALSPASHCLQRLPRSADRRPSGRGEDFQDVLHQVVCHFPILYDHNASPRSGQSRFQQVKSEPGQPIAMLHDNSNHLGIPQEVSFVFRLPISVTTLTSVQPCS